MLDNDLINNGLDHSKLRLKWVRVRSLDQTKYNQTRLPSPIILFYGMELGIFFKKGGILLL